MEAGEFNINSEIVSDSKPPSLEEISIKNLVIKKFEYSISLNEKSATTLSPGIIYWGESDNFSHYGRIYFKFVENHKSSLVSMRKKFNYNLECKNNLGDKITEHNYLFPPKLIELSATENQAVYLFAIIFKQGRDNEFFTRCGVSVEYESEGKHIEVRRIWINN